MTKDINVMIVDDEREILKMLETAFRKSEFKSVKSFYNPVEAVRAYDGSNFDVVLLDIMMPEMDGIEVLNKLKEKNKNVKVIMMTAYSTLDRVLKSHKIGADHYILKPFRNLRDVEAKIRQVLAE
ncbi:response regulator receiver protein [Denitrovibrio acetiphilus DSM 12809]|uniref:Response regulator receiver protein n=1 Tax=Denitrovibrio acetiphilus (strain DSM 12809 / NBRC 114555 / N2460) TaxID=522772 RepID=D4H0H6_DENA2|nr:response regulator [Denitrovibrio acetiphilus]ADD68489.1 response regulator receiver protein [Denitrovibrio acetiphilus DSM 12809]